MDEMHRIRSVNYPCNFQSNKMNAFEVHLLTDHCLQSMQIVLVTSYGVKFVDLRSGPWIVDFRSSFNLKLLSVLCERKQC